MTSIIYICHVKRVEGEEKGQKERKVKGKEELRRKERRERDENGKSENICRDNGEKEECRKILKTK